MPAALSTAMPLVARVYRAYFATWRLRFRLADGSVMRLREYPFGSEILAGCERDVLVLVGITAGRGFTVLVAHGRDGDWAAAVLDALGCHVVRGSARRGGAVALRALIHEIRESPTPLGLVVDGPLGPAGRAKGGAVFCALKTGRPLRALGVAARRRILFNKTWSGMFLPLPFTRVIIAVDDVAMPRAGNRADVTALTDALTAGLARTREVALQAVHASGT
jgi:hypothetical protein